MSPSLAERLKTETRLLHAAAERSAFMGVLLRGRIERAAYCELLRNLHAIYAVLEPALERHAAHPAIAPVHDPALFRTAALEHDLLALGAEAQYRAQALQPAASAYLARLHEIDAGQPELLLAHAYVRYLGDLSGGQVLHRIVAAAASFDGSRAVAFYDFGDPLRARALTHGFRVGLASITLPAAREEALVEEARFAFEMHRRLFDELAVACGLA